MLITMNLKLNIATFQLNICWEDPLKNWNVILERTKNLQADVLVLPEMFATGFSLNSATIALQNGNPILSKMMKLSKELDCAIVGSLAIEENDKYFNRLYWVNPDETVYTYDKRHLFRMAKEEQHYSSGDNPLIVTYKGVTFCPMVCYDLRFPVWSRNTDSKNYDCLLYVANWPEVRSDAWFTLLKARAIENLSYCIGVNRVGEDGNLIKYNGKSSVFDFKGQLISNHQDGKEELIVTEINLDKLRSFREAFPANLDADYFTLS